MKYEAGIKKKTAVLLGDLKGNQCTDFQKTKTSERFPANVQCRHSSGMSEEVSLKPHDQRGFMNVKTCNETSLTSGLPVKARGRASGKRELIVNVQAATEADLQKRKIVITDEGYTAFVRETSSYSVAGEWSACLG
ncbi:hypothetical protein DPMN_159300 [Dreissena polymorpha]|uniref:Uncharacterized protein n=1 Tax=Dreissena polymorpha TaxID=45954 RepID=A0A9D4EP06_DREPO|nr:hypothetical protein DPMN_159300 [Dreissena polymorpha]